MSDMFEYNEWKIRKDRSDKEWAIRKEKLADSLRVAPESMIEGLIVLGGVVGLDGIRDDKMRTMQISLKPWRYKGDADFKKTEMVITKIVEHEEIEKLRELLSENKAYQFKVKVSDYLFNTYDNALLLDVIGEVTDPILVELADEVSREVTYDDPDLGHFILDKRLKFFEAEAKYQGKNFVIRMDSDKNGDVCEDFLTELKQFWSECEAWVAQAKRFAAEDMIDDVWPDEDPDRDEVTTIEAFMDAMVLRSVSARDDLEVALEFEEDGRLVGGHNILVTIHLEDGISYVEIA